MSPVLAGAVITVGSLAAIWWVQGFASICPAIYPAPPECAPGARENAAIISSAIVAALFGVVVIVSALGQHRRRLLVGSALAALVAAGVFGCSATLGASGFIMQR